MMSDTQPTHATEGMGYIERVRYWKQSLPDGYATDYDELLASNVGPRIAAAVVRYVAGQQDDAPVVSQEAVAEQYDITPVTVRNHYPKIAPELKSKTKAVPKRTGDQHAEQTTQPAADAAEDTTTTAARATYYALYTAHDPRLTRKEVADRVSEYARETVYNALRALIDTDAVGSEYISAVKEYWAVARADTTLALHREVSPDGSRSYLDVGKFRHGRPPAGPLPVDLRGTPTVPSGDTDGDG